MELVHNHSNTSKSCVGISTPLKESLEFTVPNKNATLLNGKLCFLFSPNPKLVANEPTSRLAVFALASKDSQNSSAQTSDVVPHATLFVFLKCVSLLTIICSADTPPVNERHFSLPPVLVELNLAMLVFFFGACLR